MGRTGTLWAYQHWGVEPDIMTLAKALANGVPIGAMVARDPVAQELTPGTHASTFGGTPFVASVAIATLTTLLEEKLPERAARMGRHLTNGLLGLKAKHSVIQEVRGKGLLIGTQLTRSAAPIVAACREAGLLVLTAGDTVLRLAPPLIVDEGMCDRALAILDGALAKA